MFVSSRTFKAKIISVNYMKERSQEARADSALGFTLCAPVFIVLSPGIFFLTFGLHI